MLFLKKEVNYAMCGYLQSEDSLRAFPSLHQIEGYEERITNKPINSENDIENCEP